MRLIYACIDLKSFYASVECVERNLNPLTTNLVVADSTRTEKTICLAVTPSLKEYGISGRARLYEVVGKVKEINNERKRKIKKNFKDKSSDSLKLKKDNTLALDFIIAPPRMKLYMKYSTKIYNIYLKFLAPEDIYVYSIDEVFLNLTNYLYMYQTNPQELITSMLKEVYKETGITATAGIGTNLYLAKVAMDIVAKHIKPNKDGVRIAYLDEMLYRKKLWDYQPITDFWRIGKGISKKLAQNKIYCMGDLARCSLVAENKLFKLFGINAELLIDHAWGYEPCTMQDIKNYKPKSNSLSKGQVLKEPYPYDKAKIIVKEMVELLILEMINRKYLTDIIVLSIGYDASNLEKINTSEIELATDFYGRAVPKRAHGSIHLDYPTSSLELISEKLIELYESIVNKNLTIRRINIAVCNLKKTTTKNKILKQFDIFHDEEEIDKKIKNQQTQEKDEQNLQKIILEIKNKYGKNSILKGMNLQDGATTIERNLQVGGHKG